MLMYKRGGHRFHLFARRHTSRPPRFPMGRTQEGFREPDTSALPTSISHI